MSCVVSCTAAFYYLIYSTQIHMTAIMEVVLRSGTLQLSSKGYCFWYRCRVCFINLVFNGDQKEHGDGLHFPRRLS